MRLPSNFPDPKPRRTYSVDLPGGPDAEVFAQCGDRVVGPIGGAGAHESQSSSADREQRVTSQPAPEMIAALEAQLDANERDLVERAAAAAAGREALQRVLAGTVLPPPLKRRVKRLAWKLLLIEQIGKDARKGSQDGR